MYTHLGYDFTGKKVFDELICENPSIVCVHKVKMSAFPNLCCLGIKIIRILQIKLKVLLILCIIPNHTHYISPM